MNKPYCIDVWVAEDGNWYWHAKSRQGRILADSGGYARRGTALWYMEVATAAKKRGVPVFVTGASDTRERLY